MSSAAAAVYLALAVFLGGISLGAVAMVAVAMRREGIQFPGLRGMFSEMVRSAIRHGAGSTEGDLATGAGWRAMRLAARLMPRTAGKRWLAEAASFLAEATPALQRGAVRSYLIGAPLVILVSWAAALGRRTRLTGVARPPR